MSSNETVGRQAAQEAAAKRWAAWLVLIGFAWGGIVLEFWPSARWLPVLAATAALVLRLCERRRG